MRFSVVLFLCLVIVVVNSATTKTTRRHLVVTTERNTTKAPASKSAYAYLRTVRGKKSCAGGSCPFWEGHGRSFAALRCYSRQYQECTCLHRMCFSSCMFTRQICNQEMVSCLRQICPRCMPASATAMCAIYDSMAERVALALSVFACYPCCPNMNSANTNNTSGSSTTIPASPESSTTIPSGITDDVFGQSTTANLEGGEFYHGNENQASTNIIPGNNQNSGSFPTNNVNNGANTNGNTNVFTNGNINTNPNSNTNPNTNTYSNGNSNIYPNTNTNGNGNGIPNTNVNNNGNSNSNSNGNFYGNSNSNPNGNANSATASNSINNGNGNLANNYPGIVFPGSDAMFYNNNFPLRNQQVIKQRGRKTVGTTKRRSTTTRRTPVTTRRMAQASATVRAGSNVKSVVRKPVQVDKKPQTNNHSKS